MTEEHKRKLALGREKALANRRAKAQAKKIQKELDVLELKKMRESNKKQLEKLKAPPEEKAEPAVAPPEPEPSLEATLPPEKDDGAVPEKKKKKRKKRVIVLESSSSEEEIVVVRAPRRRKREKPTPQLNHWNRPPPRAKPTPVPRGPTPEEINANAVRKRQAFLTQCMGDRWR
jgi:hypothetical protein